ncbi:MAG TPA: GNAT family N-acetyltransferase [Solirubrobacteraceae bacterium]|nr:GNAT family N-acetyltransferase [Solirubrobacteraceae bacterium]
MTAQVVSVRPAREPREVDAALELRRAVFVDEQGVALAEELDGRDAQALHLVAVDQMGAVLGTCRLLAGGERVKLGRLAVAPHARRRGIAAALLAAAEEHAAALGARTIALAAQTHATGLYERAGYVAHGPVFMEAGIEHRHMEKTLA